jgi:hypothetical protein
LTKYHFVLDENVFILAELQQNETGAADPTCLQLLLAIDGNCHGLVITENAYPRYMSQLASVFRPNPRLATPGVVRILMNILSNLDKDNRWIPNHALAEAATVMGSVEEEDRVFVQAAATVNGSILVTTDEPLNSAVEAALPESGLAFRILHPEAALTLASEEDP